MSHRIKLRAWDAERRCFYYSTQSGVDFVFGKMGDGVYIDNLLRLDLTDENTSQCIGLTDKDGVEIYAGDILKDSKGHIGQVFWHNAGFLIEWQERSYDGTRPVEKFTDDCFGYRTVIGNIFENPKLLEATS
ncbi:YopX family protein [Rhodococcus qingshengii]|uniref:YopX family protein n=1 Tax=Rhodococcus qingshengii TaxID=334542 RepID=UPI003019D93E